MERRDRREKAGFTNAAGAASSPQPARTAKNLVCIILGDRSTARRAAGPRRALLEYGFETLTTAQISELGLLEQTVNVPNAAADDEGNGVLTLIIRAAPPPSPAQRRF